MDARTGPIRITIDVDPTLFRGSSTPVDIAVSRAATTSAVAEDAALTTAETAECGCPDDCDRDHDNE
jgi:hypothetical protein